MEDLKNLTKGYMLIDLQVPGSVSVSLCLYLSGGRLFIAEDLSIMATPSFYMAFDNLLKILSLFPVILLYFINVELMEYQ